ncbi:hypothetical protein RFI_27143, partial [Reticulomyxa filosa]
MVGTEPDETERIHAKWLRSPLFSKGREKHALEEKSEKDRDDSKEKDRKQQEKLGVDTIKDPTTPSSSQIRDNASPSWSPVVSHQGFLEDLATMKASSKAAEFARKMFGQLKREVTDSMGGKIVDQAIHFAIAAVLKHLGLVEIARKVASGSEA